ncbi:hypothetical protein CDL12_11152 [Handroanthus impetiginosus]|uniref:Trichome birefringence-like C-terminal domain-containing protein n=1 Tax=Handroanthus impetiginosus TaxID=429701 RepID=A0A2G9HFI3_9LAMI|nr:hypothetical protein CDL12_11152 [Handroanthus impetiginosus]
MFVSLFCALKRVSSEVKKWRPVGADRGFTFVNYNLTIAYHRTSLLAHYGRWSAGSDSGALESLGYKEGYRIDVDIPEGTWVEAPKFHDILIFNTGHCWWAPSKFDPMKLPMLFFEKGVPVIHPIAPDAGLDMVLRHMVSFVEKNARPGAILFFRTQSPRHFEGALKDSNFRILDTTHMSEFRADVHPSTAGGKRHDDCMHWCLPSLTDTWNDLFMAHLNSIRVRN